MGRPPHKWQQLAQATERGSQGKTQPQYYSFTRFGRKNPTPTPNMKFRNITFSAALDTKESVLGGQG